MSTTTFDTGKPRSLAHRSDSEVVDRGHGVHARLPHFSGSMATGSLMPRVRWALACPEANP
jgi:hypothetical protein